MLSSKLVICFLKMITRPMRTTRINTIQSPTFETALFWIFEDKVERFGKHKWTVLENTNGIVWKTW